MPPLSFELATPRPPKRKKVRGVRIFRLTMVFYFGLMRVIHE